MKARQHPRLQERAGVVWVAVATALLLLVVGAVAFMAIATG